MEKVGRLLSVNDHSLSHEESTQQLAMKQNIILAIDTSCDETSIAVTQGRTILANVVASQVELHRPYGGVFPTVAKLAHQENVAPALALALKRARLTPDQLDAVAVTVGPGLAPALEVGITFAQAFAQQHNKPLIAANHLEGHVCSVLAEPNRRLLTPEQSITTNKQASISFPILAIIISGRNSLFVRVEANSTDSLKTAHASKTTHASVSGHSSQTLQTTLSLERQPRLKLDTPAENTPWQPAFRYTVLGQSLDDAAGECLDKVGRMLNLGYPAGPVVEEFAKLGNTHRFPFPLPLTQVKTYDLSFSGIKTHSRHAIEKHGGIEQFSKQDIYDFCACLQTAVLRHLTYKLERLLLDSPVQYGEVWLSGGVAANVALRRAIRQTTCEASHRLHAHPPKVRVPCTKKLCGDNAAMIGVTCSNRFAKLAISDTPPSRT